MSRLWVSGCGAIVADHGGGIDVVASVARCSCCCFASEGIWCGSSSAPTPAASVTAGIAPAAVTDTKRGKLLLLLLLLLSTIDIIPL